MFGNSNSCMVTRKAIQRIRGYRRTCNSNCSWYDNNAHI